jgi:general stress protein 26
VELDAVQDRTFASASRATLAAYPAEFRLTGDRLAAYLDQRTFAVVSTTRPDGRAHAVVASYVREGATFWLPTEGGTVRLRNVRAHAWAALTVTEGDRGSHVVVLIEGRATVVRPADVPSVVTAGVTADWVDQWIRVEADRLRSYAAPGTAALVE